MSEELNCTVPKMAKLPVRADSYVSQIPATISLFCDNQELAEKLIQ